MDVDNLRPASDHGQHEDPFEELHRLEETFYQEGLELGREDGTRLGRVEGRVFGTKRAFDRFFDMARMHGHSVVLGNRVCDVSQPSAADSTSQAEDGSASPKIAGPLLDRDPELGLWLSSVKLKPLSGSGRLEKHIRALYALSEPASLAVQNTEEDVAEFDDRFKRAQAKAVIVGRMTYSKIPIGGGKGVASEKPGTEEVSASIMAAGSEANIEDTSILQARH